MKSLVHGTLESNGCSLRHRRWRQRRPSGCLFAADLGILPMMAVLMMVMMIVMMMMMMGRGSGRRMPIGDRAQISPLVLRLHVVQRIRGGLFGIIQLNVRVLLGRAVVLHSDGRRGFLRLR